MTSLGTALRAARALGFRSSSHFLLYQVALKSGWLRRQTPIRSWQSFEAQSDANLLDGPSGTFFWDPDNWQPPGHLVWSQAARAQAVEQGDRVLAGVFPLFAMHHVDLGFPPDWHGFPPMAGTDPAESADAARHWTRYSLDDFGADVKLLWEPSRFSWAFVLGRAYRWTQERKYAHGFWQLFESWLASHQANAGPHWISAQEVALRLLALGFASYCFAAELDESQQRRLQAVIRAHADRIPFTVAYSRSQRNNHLLAEAAGLMTAGLLFPSLKGAKRWLHDGYRWFVDGLADQVFEDGGYRQHSINYGRMALELGLWVKMLCLRNGLSLPDKSEHSLARLTDWLSDMIEPGNGRGPNFGPNDGTLLLPLTSCDFADYRPTLQAARAILGGKAPYPAGPWNELTLWFGTEPSPRQIKKLPARKDHPEAGVFSFGVEGAHGFLRAARFKSRPGHIDQMHLDIWREGVNIALDPGTYLYNAAPPWDNRLAAASVHNTLVVDRKEPMERIGRFLWLDWSQAQVKEKVTSAERELELMTAEHDGYHSIGVTHRRQLLRAGSNLLLVIDDVLGEGEHELCFPWLLPMSGWRAEQNMLELEVAGSMLSLEVEGSDLQSSLYSAGERLFGPELPSEQPQWGWYSPTYALKEPALHWVSWWRGRLPVQVRTWWCFDGASPADLEFRWDKDEVPALRTVHFGGATLRR